MCRYRRTNPKHSLLWFSIDGLSYSESAQGGFVPHNYRACDFSTYVCLASSSVIVKEIWWRHQPHVSEGEHGHAITPFCLPWVSEGWCHPEREQKRWASVDSSTSVCLSACLSGHVVGNDDNRATRGVQRPCRIANLPGHLARLTLFKQVPRRLVSCLVKWLTFWFNQHPRLPDELDHYQKCTGSAMSLTCQNQTHLLIYLLHSPWEEHCSTVWA